MREQKPSTLCWKCSKGANECSFMQDLEPVPNWKAKKVWCEGGMTYHVISCPNFKPFTIAGRKVEGKRTKVRCVETGRVYPSATKCAKELKISACYLSNCLCGRTPKNSIRGLHFEWVV